MEPDTKRDRPEGLPENPAVTLAMDFVAVWLMLAGLFSTVAAVAHAFSPWPICLGSLTLTFAIFARRDRRVAHGKDMRMRSVVLLILVSLFFRVPAFNYTFGGQDEGVYVNIANHILHTHHLALTDRPLKRMHGTGFERTYLNENRRPGVSPSNSSAGSYVPGVYVNKVDGSKLTFQFYYLFPAMMALVGGLLGSSLGVSVLTLFAVVSVLMFYRLCRALGCSERLALAGGLLLAVSPLHIFFSRYPVSEIPALTFTLIGFVFLLDYVNAPRADTKKYLGWSVMAFLALFLTRISGFMYLPFLMLVPVIAAWFDEAPERRRSLLWWSIGIVAAYALSVWYGLEYSRYYSLDIYTSAFRPFFGPHWGRGLTGLLVLGVLAWIGAVWLGPALRRHQAMRQRVLRLASLAIASVLVLALIIGLIKIYRLGWTQHYENVRGLGSRWHLSGQGWLAASASSLWTIVVYCGPFIPLYFLARGLKRQATAAGELLRIMVVGFFAYVALLTWFLPFGPYYHRYLLSFMVPFMMLFVLYGMAHEPSKAVRRGMQVLVAATLGYSVFAAASQLGMVVGTGYSRDMKALVSPVSKGDVILLITDDPRSAYMNSFRTTLLFTENRDVINITPQSLDNTSYLAAISGKYNTVFVMSMKPVRRDDLQLAKSWQVTFHDASHVHAYPDGTFVRFSNRMYLYRLVFKGFPPGVPEPMSGRNQATGVLGDGWAMPEDWGTWTDASHAVIHFPISDLPGKGAPVRVSLEGHAFVNPNHRVQHVLAYVDGQRVAACRAQFPVNTCNMQFDARPQAGQGLVITLHLPDAASPAETGASPDSRLLGYGITAVSIGKAGQPGTGSP